MGFFNRFLKGSKGNPDAVPNPQEVASSPKDTHEINVEGLQQALRDQQARDSEVQQKLSEADETQTDIDAAAIAELKANSELSTDEDESVTDISSMKELQLAAEGATDEDKTDEDKANVWDAAPRSGDDRLVKGTLEEGMWGQAADQNVGMDQAGQDLRKKAMGE